MLGLGRKCLCLSKTGWNEVDGDSLGAERVTCPLLVTTVKLALSSSGLWGQGPKPGAGWEYQEAKGPALWAELRSRSQVSGQSLCRPRPGGQKPAHQSGLTSALRHQHPAGPVWRLCMFTQARARAGSQACVQGQGGFLGASLYQPLQMYFGKYHT